VSRPLKTYTVCLNVQLLAADEEQAMDMAKAMKDAIELAQPFPYKAEVEIDDLEEL
jgi:hypothetical protein